MALDSGYWETGESNITMDGIAAQLIKLYADYQSKYGDDDDYAMAVAIAIRMLSNE